MEQLLKTPSQPATPTQTGQPATATRDTLTGAAVFLGRRLLTGLLTLLVIIFVTFLGLNMAEGATFGPALGDALFQSGAYLGNLLQGDLGLSTSVTSTALPLPVGEVLPDLLGRSLGLLGLSLLLATIVGLILGLRAARNRHSDRSLLILLISILGISAPSFFVALLLQIAAISWTRWTGRMLLPLGGFGWDNRLILPMLVLAARPIAQITRITFIAVSDVLGQDYVRTAYAKGLRRTTVMGRHVFRNAAVPILTTIGLSLHFSLSSLPVVEFFFGWPGVGFTLLRSIAQRDDNLTVALLLCLGLLFIVVNLLLEGVYRLVDPRLRDLPAHLSTAERHTFTQFLKAIAASARGLLAEWSPRRWLARRRPAAEPSPFRAILEQNGADLEAGGEEGRASNWRMWLHGTIGNLPFVLGALLVGALLLVVLFGPQLAPHSPYTTHGLKFEGGEFSVPPFEPSELYPWGSDVLGRDIMSLILAGAQQTLLLVVLVMLARMAVGITLGAMAGWGSGSWVDRLILGAAETIAAFPTLLLAMLLILGLGIRQGLRPFLIAFCFVGWAEIMQFVRSEVIAIRPQPYIESAVAVGLRTPGIILRHIIPNLLTALISIAALEMGAILMLLGELGFIGIFIGGGAFAELDWGGAPYHYSDVPEWGSLLSNVRRYARTYTWTAIYPALAFFTAILGFNLFGEGLRRMVERVGVGVTRLLNRYTFGGALLALLVLSWARSNTGSVAFYRQDATEFDGQRAYEHVAALTAPEMEGRAPGTAGITMAAATIAGQFQALGLQPAGRNFTFFQERERSYEQLLFVPTFTIDDGGPTPVYQQDYIEFPASFVIRGEIAGPVRFLGTGELASSRVGFNSRLNFEALDALDYTGQIVLVLSPAEAFRLQFAPTGGILVVADDERDLARRVTLPGGLPQGVRPQDWQDAPQLRISEATANRLLAGTGQTVAGLRRTVDELGPEELMELTTGVSASMKVVGTVRDKVRVANVIGHLPGTNDALDSNLIVVMAQYDAPPLGPDDVAYPGANDNASAVGVMLEAIRVMQEGGYQPYKTFLFVAYSGEGQEGGGFAFPDVNRFLQAKTGFSTAFDTEAIVELRGLGAGEGDELLISAGGSLRLADLFERAAGQMSVGVERAREPVDISIVFEERNLNAGGQEAPQLTVTWQGWEATSRTPADTLDTISVDNLSDAGRSLALALMILGRETQY